MSIPDGTNDGNPPAHDGGILGALEQFTASFLRRHDAPPPPPPPHLHPVVDSQLLTPPYAGMADEAPGRYQQEVHILSLTAASPTGTTRFHTRCDYYSIVVFPRVAAGTNDLANGVWVLATGTPPPAPLLTAGTPQRGPLRVFLGQPLQVHGAEQTLSFTLDSAVDLTVIITANTNVPVPYQ